MKRRLLRTLIPAALLSAFILVPATAAQADDPRDAEWHLGFLHMASAWQISQGEGETVALLDYGVNGDHPDLAGNVLQGTSLVPGHPGNGWEDVDFHGTGMASLIAAHGHNGTEGLLGIAPKAKILPVQLGSGDTWADADTLAVGMNYAVDHGARIISVALGYPGGSAKLQDAVERAEKADVVIVAAVGNLPETTSVSWPARYPGVVAVAAVDDNGEHADFSVTGPRVLISAPGVDVESAYVHDGY